MHPNETPSNFNHNVALGVPLAFTDAWEMLKERFAFPQVGDRITAAIYAAIADTDRLDIARYALPFTSNKNGLVNMEAVFVIDDNSLAMQLTYHTGVAAHDPSAMGKIVATVRFNYFGPERQITSASNVVMWYEDPNYKSPYASFSDLKAVALDWVAEVNPEWALENVPLTSAYKMYSTIEGPLEAPAAHRELRITVEGLPRTGKTVVLARIARLLQRELGLVTVTIEGVDDTPKAFQEKADLPDAVLREILRNTPGIRLIERHASPAEKFSALEAQARKEIDDALKTAVVSTQAPSIESITQWALNAIEAALPPLTPVRADGQYDGTEFDILRFENTFKTHSTIADVPQALVSIEIKSSKSYGDVAKYYVEVTTVIEATPSERSQGWSPRTSVEGYRITSLPFLSLAARKSSEVEWGFVEKGVPDIVRNLTGMYNQVVSKHKLQ